MTTEVTTLFEDNVTIATAAMPDMEELPAIVVIINRLLIVTTPVICVLGFVGNSLAAGVFLTPKLRRTSCCLYLAAKNISDICFLVSSAVVWLHRLRVPLFHTEGVCQIMVFFSYVAPFLSVWLVVLITTENFIRIAQPALVAKLCTPRVSKLVLCALLVLALSFFSFSFWTSGVISTPMGSGCTTRPQFTNLVVVFNWVDSFLTLIVPFVLLLLLLPLVAGSALRAYKRKKRLDAGKNRKDPRSTPESKVTKMLLAVTVVFVVLHTPNHAIRIKRMIAEVFRHLEQSQVDVVLHNVFEVIYYLDSCVSLGVYLTFGDNFRKVFKNKYCWRCRTQPPRSVTRTTDCTVCTQLLNGTSTADDRMPVHDV